MAKKITKKSLKNVAPKKKVLKVININNADGEPDTQATILIQNKINYTPKVSVIIPVYNASDYLHECLDSLINQTLKNIEIICVDDGSTDNSLEILKKYADKDGRITVISQKNLHAGVARNAGLAVAKGEYIHFVDSDDWIDLDTYEEVLPKEPVDICIFSGERVDYTANKKFEMSWLISKKLKGFYNSKDLYNDLYGGFSPEIWNKLYRRSFLNINSIRFQNIVSCNDIYFSYVSLGLSKKIYVKHLVKYHYRFNTGKQISTIRGKYPLNVLTALNGVKTKLGRYNHFKLLKQSLQDIAYKDIIYAIKKCASQDLLSEYLSFFDEDTKEFYAGKIKDATCKIRPIVFATNDNYAKYLSVTMLSVMDNIGSGSICKFYVLCDRLSDENKDKLKSIIKSPATLEFINVSDYIKGIDLYESDYFTREMYYRFLIPQIFSDFERVLYLDCDMIVQDDVSKLFEIDLGDNFIAAVKDLCTKNKRNIITDILNIDPKDYFNSGFIVFNIKQWNKFNLTQKCFDSVAKYPNLWTPDQDILNMVCNKGVLFLGRNWNFIWQYLFTSREKYSELDEGLRKEYETAVNNPSIIHYTSAIKPWNCKNERLSNVWWTYAVSSPFYEEISSNYKDVIISLTSYPARIATVNQTIESLLHQTRKADKVILWLAPEQFPNKEADLPKQLLDLRSDGLTIDWYHDIRSYKKLIPTLQKYPDAIIVTADDDNIYEPYWLDKLYKSYVQYPEDIQCHRVTKFVYTNEGFRTISGGKEYYRGASYLNKLVGLGGVLYPPHCFYKDILDEKLIMELAPTNDDQWFWIQAALNGTKVRVVANPDIAANYIPGTQETGLTNINDKGQKLFWKDFSRLMKYYPEVKRLFIEESKKYKEKIVVKDRLRQDLETWYKKATGNRLNLDNPKTFNEKIQWLKLYASTPLKTKLADKFLVRDWVKEKIGEKYLIPLLGVYDKFEDIDFSKLPDKFVIKCNHGCAYNIIVKDKSKLDLDDVKAKLDKWMSENFAFKWGFELQYRDIKPKIIIEKYIENKHSGGDLYDYKFWCFNGKVEYIQFLSERNIDGLKSAFYDRKWRKQNFTTSATLDNKTIEKPDNLEEMIKLVETLSKEFNYVRTDLYRLDDGTIYFGEMTFTPASGVSKWTDNNINVYFGRKLILPEFAYNIDTEEYYKFTKKSKLKAYLLFPYYLCKLWLVKKEYRKALRNKIAQQLCVFRLDIKNNGGSDNDINIVTENAKVIKPAWFKNEKGQGAVLESNAKEIRIQITVVKNGALSFAFKAPDRRCDGKRFPVYAKYASIKIDGRELLSEPISVWHDAPFKYEMPVKDGQMVDVIITQRPHKYKLEELGELILKLNPNSDYIKQNITGITKRLGMYTEKKKDKKSQPQRNIKILKFCGLKFRVLDKHAEIMGVVQSMRDDMFEAIKLQNDRISSIDRSIQDMKRGMELSISNQTRKLSADIISVNSNVINSLNKSLDDVLSDLDKSAKSLQNLFGSTVLMLSNNFVDALKQAADSMSYNFNVMLNDKIIDLNQSLDGKLKQNIEGLHNQLNILATEQSFLKETLDTALGNQISRVIKDLTSVSEFIQNLLKLNSDLSDSLTGLNSSFDDRLNAKYNRLIDRINFVSDLAHKILKNNSDLSDAIVGVNKNIGDGLLQNQQQIINSISSVSDLSQNILEYNKDLSDVISELNQKIEAGTDEHQKTLIENVNSITELIKQVLKYNFDLSKTISGINDSFKDQLNVNNNQLNECIHSVTGLTQKMSQNNSDILNAIAELDKQQSAIKNATEQTGAAIAEIQSGIANDLKSLPIEIETKQRNIAKLYSEPYWANIYHDTIINSTWLKDKSVSPGRWAVSYIVLYVLYRVLNEVKPASILECGLGQSSKLMVQYAQNNNADLIICENNPDWASFFEKNFPGADRYIKLLDVEMVEVVPPYKSRTYVGFKDAIKGKKFNMIMIDGPLGSERYSRPQILDVVDNLADSFVIMLDDMNRIGEQETWGLLKEKLVARGIKFVEKIYSSDKDLGVICSPDLEFLTSL